MSVSHTGTLFPSWKIQTRTGESAVLKVMAASASDSYKGIFPWISSRVDDFGLSRGRTGEDVLNSEPHFPQDAELE